MRSRHHHKMGPVNYLFICLIVLEASFWVAASVEGSPAYQHHYADHLSNTKGLASLKTQVAEQEVPLQREEQLASAAQLLDVLSMNKARVRPEPAKLNNNTQLNLQMTRQRLIADGAPPPTRESGLGGAAKQTKMSSSALGFSWKWLDKLLANTSIPIPIPPISLGLLGDVTISDFFCRKPQIGNLEWTYALPDLAVTASGLSVECDGKVSWGVIRDATISASVDQSSLAIGVQFGFTDGFPSSAKTPSATQQCETTVNIDQVQISGLAGGVVSALIKVFKPLLQSTISKQICGLVEPLVNTNLTQVLHTASDIAQPLIAPLPPPPAAAPVPSGMVNWGESSVVGLVDLLLDTTLMGMTAADRINSVIRKLLGDGGKLTIPFPASLPPATLNSSIANFSIALLSATVDGLDSFGSFDVLEPQDRYSLKSDMKLDRLNISVDLNSQLWSNVAASEHLDTNLTVGLALDDLVIGLEALAAVKQAVLLQTRLSELGRVDCLLETLYAMNFSEVLLTYSKLQLSVQSSDGDQDFSDIATSLVNTAYALVEGSAMQIMSHLVGGAGREELNSVLAGAISGAAACEAPAPTPPHDVDWAPLAAVSEVLSNATLVNEAIELIAPGGTFSMQGLVKSFAPFAGFQLNVSDLLLDSLNTFTNLTLLQPTGEYSLFNHIQHERLGVNVSSAVGVQAPGVSVLGLASLSASAAKLEVLAEVLLKVDPAPVLNLTLSQLGEERALISALLSSLDAVDIEQFSGKVLELAMDVAPTKVLSRATHLPPPIVPPLPTTGVLKWNDSVVVKPETLNRFMESLLGDGGTVTTYPNVTIFSADLIVATVDIELSNVSIAGLDTFTAADLLVANGTSRFGSRVSTEELLIEIGLNVKTSWPSGEISRKALAVSMQAEDLGYDLNAVLAVLSDKARALSIGQLLSENRSTCLIDTLEQLEIVHLDLNYTQLQLQVRGLSEELDGAVSDLLSYAMDLFTQPVVFNLLQGSVRPAINQALVALIQKQSGGACEAQTPAHEYVNWQSALKTLDSTALFHNSTLLDRLVTATLKTLNSSALPSNIHIDSTDGTMQLDLAVPITVPLPVPEGTPAFAVGVSSVGISGINSFTGTVDLIEASSNESVSTHMAMKQLSLSIGLVLDFNHTAAANTLTRPTGAYDVFTVNVDMSGFQFDTHSDLKLNLATLYGLGIQQLTQNAMCLATPVEKLQLGSPVMQIDAIGLILQNNTKIEGFAQLDKMLHHYLPPALLKTITDTLISDLQKGGFLVNLINPLLVTALQRAADSCNGVPPAHDGGGSSFASSAEFIGGVLVLLIMAGGIGLYIYRRYRLSQLHHDSESLLAPNEPAEITSGPLSTARSSDQFRADDMSCIAKFDRFMEGSLLYQDQHISLWVRVVIPFIVLGNLVLFLSSNLGLGAAVTVQLEYSQTVFFSVDTFDFSLGNSVRDMWQAEVYALSLLIAVCSGGWPYLKLILVLIAWCCPAAVLSLKGRGTLLEALDALGKWSLVDSFVLVMMMVAFRFHIGLPGGYFGLPADLVALNVIVSPGWGFYGFLLATVMSLIVSHIAIMFHRAAVTEDAWNDSDYTGEGDSISTDEEQLKAGLHSRQSLMAHPFQVPVTYSWSRLGRSVVLLIILATFGLILVGCTINVYSFEFEGLTSFLAPRSFSLYTTATEISRYDKSFGIRCIQLTFILFGMIVPLMHMISLAVLWVAPLSLRTQHKLFVTTEILNAWSALEVFVVSVVCALLELPTFAQFIIGGKCDIPNDIIYDMDHATPPVDIGHGEDLCFDVKATLQSGCWVLFGAMLIGVVVIQLVTRSAAQAMDERLYRATGRLSKASGLEHVEGWKPEEGEEEQQGEGCAKRCAARNKRFNHSVNVGFFKLLGAAHMVRLGEHERLKLHSKDENPIKQEDEAYRSYEEYVSRTSSTDIEEEVAVVQPEVVEE